jgi:hypothetical protein
MLPGRAVRADVRWVKQWPPLVPGDTQFPSPNPTPPIFGWVSAISGDGNTAIVGSRNAPGNYQGAAYIFVRGGSGWAPQGHALRPCDGQPHDGEGVALSKDGNTALVGDWNLTVNGNAYQGGVYVFVRTGTTWTQQAGPLTESDGQAHDEFGITLALSDDGNIAAIGGGGVYLFRRQGARWTQDSNIVRRPGSTGRVGGFVSLSGDGNTMLLGGAEPFSHQPAYVLTWNGTTWATQGTLDSSDATSDDGFGMSLALSKDGNTALVGAPDHKANPQLGGAVYVFVRNGSSWAQQGKPIVDTGDRPTVSLGQWVSLSADGTVAFMREAGTQYVYSRSGGTWSRQPVDSALPATILTQASINTPSLLSDDGSTALLTADLHYESYGDGVYVLHRGKANGDACTSTSECGSGDCVDGVCCDSPCTPSACHACAAAHGATQDGTCTLLTSVSGCGECAVDSDCTPDDYCTAKRVCAARLSVVCPSSSCLVAANCQPCLRGQDCERGSCVTTSSGDNSCPVPLGDAGTTDAGSLDASAAGGGSTTSTGTGGASISGGAGGTSASGGAGGTSASGGAGAMSSSGGAGAMSSSGGSGGGSAISSDAAVDGASGGGGGSAGRPATHDAGPGADASENGGRGEAGYGAAGRGAGGRGIAGNASAGRGTGAHNGLDASAPGSTSDASDAGTGEHTRPSHHHGCDCRVPSRPVTDDRAGLALAVLGLLAVGRRRTSRSGRRR